MNIIFLTNLSEACTRAAPAVSRLLGDRGGRLTVLHAHNADTRSTSSAREALDALFADAPRDADIRRIVHEGSLFDAMRTHVGAHDLVVAPGLRRRSFAPWVRSTHAALVSACAAPVWTVGPEVDLATTLAAPRRIACLLDPMAKDHSYLRFAARLAADIDAQLQVLHVTPDFFEGEVSTASGPLCASEVEEVVRAEIGLARVSVHVSPGGSSRSLRDLTRACAPTLLVVNPRGSFTRGLLGERLPSIAYDAGCPVVLFGPGVQAGLAATQDGQRIGRAPAYEF